MQFADNDCSNVDNFYSEYKDKLAKESVILIILLVELHNYCVEKIKSQTSQDSFLKEEELKLLKYIKESIHNQKVKLLKLSGENLKFLGNSLINHDLENRGNSFYKISAEAIYYPVNSLFKKYQKQISNNLSKLDKKSPLNKKEEKLKNELEKEKKDLEIFGNRKEVNKESIERIDKHLKMRRDCDSLYRISSNIKTSLESWSKVDEKERRLILQGAFHVTGEYLKSSDQSPNLSELTVKALKGKGIPIQFLTAFRDSLAHHQLFRLIEENDSEEIKNLIEKGLPAIKTVIDSEIVNIEKEFITELIKKNIAAAEVDQELSKKLEVIGKQSLKDVVKQIEYIKEEGKYETLGEKGKIFIDEIYGYAKQMKSKDFFHDQLKVLLPNQLDEEKYKIKEFVTEFIKEPKVKLYKKLHEEIIESALTDSAKALLNKAHEDLLVTMEVMRYFRDGDINLTKEDFYKDLATQYKSEEDATYIQQVVTGKVKELYLKRFRQEYDLLKEVTYPYAVASQIINTYNSLEGRLQYELGKEVFKGQEAIIEEIDEEIVKKVVKSLVDKVAELNPVVNELVGTVAKESDKQGEKALQIKVLRNYLAHGDTSINLETHEKLLDSVAKVKNEVIQKLGNFYHAITFTEINDAIKYLVTTNEDMKIIQSMICPSIGKKRLPADCILWEEIDIFNEEKFFSRDLKKIRIDSEAFLQVLIDELSKNDKKFNNYLTLAGEVLKNNKEFNDYLALTGSILKVENQLLNNRNAFTAIEYDPGKMKIAKLINAQKGVDYMLQVGKTSDIIMRGILLTDITGALLSKDYGTAAKLLIMAGVMEVTPMFVKNLSKFVSAFGQVMSPEIVTVMVNYLAINMTPLKVMPYTSMKLVYSVASKLNIGSKLTMLGKGLGPALGAVAVAFEGYTFYKNIERCINEGVDQDCVVYSSLSGVSLVVSGGVLGIQIAALAGGVTVGTTLTATGVGTVIGVGIIVGTRVYYAVRQVQKINEQISLTGTENFQEEIRAALFMGPSTHISALMEEKNANNQLVKNAIRFLEKNKDIQKYVFPSAKMIKNIDFIECGKFEAITDEVPPVKLFNTIAISSKCEHIKDGEDYMILDGATIFNEHFYYQRYKKVITYEEKAISNKESLLYLNIKHPGMRLSRTSPDNPDKGSIICAPIGDGKIVSDPTYYCYNAIGIEYTQDRTGNVALINLGYGEHAAVGFLDQENYFIVSGGKQEFIGGRKNDHFNFQVESSATIKAVIDGEDGINTIEIGRLDCKKKILADFNYGIVMSDRSSDVSIEMYNINNFLGRKDKVDEVVAICNTKYIDGRGGRSLREQDRVTILLDNGCLYDTTIIVNPNTIVQNNAVYGNFHYHVVSKTESKAYINLNINRESNNIVIFDNTLFDIMSIDKASDSVRFNFIKGVYEKNFGNNAKSDVIISGISNNNIQYYLMNNSNIVIQNEVVYALQRSDKSIGSLPLRDYSNVAKRLKIPIVILSDASNAFISVGSGSAYDTLQNDPSKTTHLVGNSIKTTFDIVCGSEESNCNGLPIPEVVIHNFGDVNESNTLDFTKIKEKLNDKKVDIEIKTSGKNLVMQVFYDDVNILNRKKSVIKVTLKDTLNNNWHEKLQIMMSGILMNINKVNDNFKLIPEPLIFNITDEHIIIVNEENVERSNELKVNRPIGNYTFARDNNNLLVTNILNSNANLDEGFTIIFNNTYYGDNTNRIKKLKIKFNDQEIVLSKEASRINSAESYQYLIKKYIISTYRDILNTPVNINNTNINQEQLNLELFEAINRKDLYSTKKLIKQGANINAKTRDDYWKKPIHRAAWLGQMKIVELLLSNGVDINDPDRYNWTALHHAANFGNLEAINFLIGKGADINRENVYGKKPIHRAAENNYKNIIELFLSNGVDINSLGGGNDTPLRCAAWNGHIDTVMYLLNKGATINVGDIEYLLKKGVSIDAVDKDDKTLLHWACIRGNLEVVRFLISKGANINAEVVFDDTIGVKPIHIATKKNSKEIAELLFNNGASVDEIDADYDTPLHWSAEEGNLEFVKFLIEKGANINAENYVGEKAVHIADEQHHSEIVRYLEKFGERNRRSLKDEINQPIYLNISSKVIELNSQNKVNVITTKLNDRLSNKAEKIDGSTLNNISSTKITNIGKILLNSVTKGISNITKNLFSNTSESNNRVIRSIEDIIIPSQILQQVSVANAIPHINNGTQNNVSTVMVQQVPVNSTILLADLIVRKLTGKKYSATTEQSISETQAMSIAYNITENFIDEAKLEEAVDFIGFQTAISKAIMRGDGIKKTVDSYLKDTLSKFGAEIHEDTNVTEVLSTVVKDIVVQQQSSLNIQKL